MKELPARFLKHTADNTRLHYVLLVEPGVAPDHLLNPRFWVNHVRNLRPLDLIEVIAEDGSYEMRLRVMGFVTSGDGDGPNVTRTGIKMRELDRKIFGEIVTHEDVAEAKAEREAPVDIGGLTVTWGGPAHKFRILDGTRLISKGHKTKEAAQEAAAAYLEQLKAA
jgi:hypothetical protein